MFSQQGVTWIHCLSMFALPVNKIVNIDQIKGNQAVMQESSVIFSTVSAQDPKLYFFVHKTVLDEKFAWTPKVYSYENVQK